MTNEDAERLRVVVADGDSDRLNQVTQAVTALGHGVILHESTLDEIATVTRTERADVAIVLVEQSSKRALDLIGKIVRQAACPVIAILGGEDPAFVTEAAKRGVFAYITDGEDPVELQGSIDIALRRFAEYRDLEGAFGRRAILERAKGILMERHSLDEQAAFSILRDHARSTNQKVMDVAEAVVTGHPMLPAKPKGLARGEG